MKILRKIISYITRLTPDTCYVPNTLWMSLKDVNSPNEKEPNIIKTNLNRELTNKFHGSALGLAVTLEKAFENVDENFEEDMETIIILNTVNSQTEGYGSYEITIRKIND